MKPPGKECVTIRSALAVVQTIHPRRNTTFRKVRWGEITHIPEVFLQNHASPSRLLTTRKAKKARI